jgi:hypothetical protein
VDETVGLGLVDEHVFVFPLEPGKP